MLRELLKKKLDQLNEEQLQQIADFTASIESQTRQRVESVPFWQRATAIERVQNFREWVSQLPPTNQTLPDRAFDRSSIYES